MSFLRRLLGRSEEQSPAPASRPAASPIELVVGSVKTQMALYRAKDYGCLVDEHSQAKYFWISEDRYHRPRDGLMLELQMYLSLEKARRIFDASFDFWVAYEKGNQWEALIFVPVQGSSVGGYIVTIDGEKFKTRLEQGDR